MFPSLGLLVCSWSRSEIIAYQTGAGCCACLPGFASMRAMPWLAKVCHKHGIRAHRGRTLACSAGASLELSCMACGIVKAVVHLSRLSGNQCPQIRRLLCWFQLFSIVEVHVSVERGDVTV